MNLDYSHNYFFTDSFIAKLLINPNRIFFFNEDSGVEYDTTLKVTAINADFEISNITSTNSCFTISPDKFSLNKGDSIELTLSFFPVDSSYNYTKFDIINNVCATHFYSSGGFIGKEPQNKTIVLTHPNGGEFFVAGSDTVITWEGIPNNQIVHLYYSIDNGEYWKFITDSASGLSYNWNDINKPVSDECLIRVKQIDQGSIGSTTEIEWQKKTWRPR